MIIIGHQLPGPPVEQTGGWLALPVLEFLKGRPYDDAARAAVTTLRPSAVRVIRDGWVKTDARVWRVTVYLKPDETVERIVQEVQFQDDSCTYRNGYALSQALGVR